MSIIFNKKNTFYNLLIIISILNRYINASLIQNNTIKNIYIFIHGTQKYTIPALFFPSIQQKLTIKRWKETINKKAEKFGLININNIDNINEYLKQNYGLYATVEKLKSNSNLCFNFNWDGELSNQNRSKASNNLANNILDLKKKYPDAKITIIGYSHGGNVAAQIFDFIPKQNSIIIDNLILLATPIGTKTEQWINKKKPRGEYNFKNVYIFFSSADFTQIKDIFFHFPFCGRYIKSRKKNIFNYKVNFIYESKITDTESFIYLPNHKDFWQINKSKIIKNKTFFFYPLIYYIKEILDQSPPPVITFNKLKNIYELQIPLLHFITE